MLAAIALLAAVAAHADLAEVHTFDDVMQAFHGESKVRVVNVWATWCVPCVAEIGEIQTVADKYRPKGVQVVGVSLDDAVGGERVATKQHVVDFLTKRNIHFRNVYFIGTSSQLTDQLHFDGSIPITLVFDANGKEIARNEGKLDRAWFEKQLDRLTKGKSK